MKAMEAARLLASEKAVLTVINNNSPAIKCEEKIPNCKEESVIHTDNKCYFLYKIS